jgi:hypothetical protein
VESGLWDFLLLRRFRAVCLDLADQRLTSGMVHGPEFGLTPLERERSSQRGLHTEGAMLVAALDFAGQRRHVIMKACRGGTASRAAPRRLAHLVAAALVAGRGAEPACCGGHDDGQPAAG